MLLQVILAKAVIFLMDALARWSNYYHQKQTEHTLNGLSDEILDDIGLYRANGEIRHLKDGRPALPKHSDDIETTGFTDRVLQDRGGG